MINTLNFEYGDKTIQELVLLFNNHQLNLEPGFQRDSFWTINDRKKFIESIFQNYPIPSIFLYKRSDNGKLTYDVIDGKQRLESILMFQGVTGFKGMRFSIKSRFGPLDEVIEWSWKRVQQKGHEHKLMSYKIQTVDISGELSDIVDLFVRINSTGKRLTGAEKRHARFFFSPFLKQASKLALREKEFFLKNRILSPSQISRMKHVELVCELIASIHSEGPINKKTALDSIIGGQSINAISLKRCVGECHRILNIIRKMFPALHTTRFAHSVDFYSLFLLVWQLDKSRCILTNPRRNRQAQVLLTWLSNGVDTVRQQLKRTEAIKPEQRLFGDYFLTIQAQTDYIPQRKKRGEILGQVLGGLFEKKDAHRSFTIEQRRLIWHSDELKKCAKCGERLTWNNFTIDHIRPHSRGGKTSMDNAKIMCRQCNSKKGAK